ncbi:hypothetical protein BD324DRAFT_651116 [Kockovaella imperatae]|uniref:Transcription factor TFIIIB component B'' Myb domain-containing protein n=1 Tax=Kockovaella imperatae TaxID=4999 RepID=A0A1Y1UEZ3_9TREE|nr:hypothetical protein BD324DRAFT_651116 [Kockovaella imperatae]ORX36630.1 hypothetical protein BD324DRAFT_651116 [Kockovaella imperatae]
MLRLPSSQNKFKPTKPAARRSGPNVSHPPPASQVKPVIPGGPPASQLATQLRSSEPESENELPTPTATQESSIQPPSISSTQATIGSQIPTLAPPTISSPVLPPAPGSLNVEPIPAADVETTASPSRQQRQTSIAPSLNTVSSVNRAGRPALIQAAAAQAAIAVSPKRVRGRIPSRSAVSNKDNRAMSNDPSASQDVPIALPQSVGAADSIAIPSEEPRSEVSAPAPPVINVTGPSETGLPPSIASFISSSISRATELHRDRGPEHASSSRQPLTSRQADLSRVDEEEEGLPASNKRSRKASNRIVERPIPDINGSNTETQGAEKANGENRPPPPKRKAPAKKRTSGEAGDPSSVLMPVRRPQRVRRRAYLDPQGTDRSAEGDFHITQKRVPYKTRGVAGTSADRRLGANKQKRGEKSIPVSISVLNDAQAGDHVGEEVVVTETTMAALATHTTAGKVSARGLVLHEYLKSVETTKNKERPKRIEDAWRRKQAQRRKLRAERNVQRAERRRHFEDMGTEANDVVSEDEEDSEEEFEVRPEWLRSLDDEEDIRRGRQTRDAGQDDDGQEDRDNEERQEQSEDDPMEDHEVRSHEDEHDAALRASGFIVAATGNGEEGVGDDGDSDDEEREDGGEDDGDGVGYDLEEYRREVEERRRRNLERIMGQGVVEENNELKMVNSSTYGRRPVSERWTDADTELFFIALSEVGPTPSYLLEYFRGRTHRQLKNKLNREAELNPLRYKAALSRRKRPDAAFLNENRGIDLHAPHEAEVELFESAALGKVNARRRDLGLPDEEAEETEREIPMAEDVMRDDDDGDDDEQ